MMDSTRLGTRVIKVTYHRPNWPPRQYKRETWKGSSSPVKPKSILSPLASTKAEPAPSSDTQATEETDATEETEAAEAAETTEATVETGSDSESTAESDDDATSTSSSVKGLATWLETINLGELTLESLSDMTPTKVLKVVQFGGDSLLRQLDITPRDDKFMPRFTRAAQMPRLDIIRYIIKVAPVSSSLR